MSQDLLHTRLVGGHGGVVGGWLDTDDSPEQVVLTHSKGLTGGQVQGTLHGVGIASRSFQDQAGRCEEEDVYLLTKLNSFPQGVELLQI